MERNIRLLPHAMKLAHCFEAFLQDAYQRWAPGRGTVLHGYADGMCLVATGEVRGEVCQIGFCLDEVDDLGPVFRDSVRKRLAEGPDVIHTVEF
jgi:hypothetical protein